MKGDAAAWLASKAGVVWRWIVKSFYVPLGLAASLVTLFPSIRAAVWAVLRARVPLWSVLLAALLVGTICFAVARLRIRRAERLTASVAPEVALPLQRAQGFTASVAAELTLPHELGFDYLPDSPVNHGWKLTLERGTRQAPTFSKDVDGNFGNVLRVAAPHAYALDYELSPVCLVCRELEFLVLPGARYGLYARVRMASRSEGGYRDGWWNFRLNEPTVHFRPYEWKVAVVPTERGRGWKSVVIDLPRTMEHTFGEEGWRYAGLSAIRLRGEMRLACLRLSA